MTEDQHLSELNFEQPGSKDQLEQLTELYVHIQENYPDMPAFTKVTSAIHMVAVVKASIYKNKEPLAVATDRYRLMAVVNGAVKTVSELFQCTAEVANALIMQQINNVMLDNSLPVGITSPKAKVTEVYDERFQINPKLVVNKYEYWYLNLLIELINAPGKGDRTGTGTRSFTHLEYKHDLRESFPMIRSRWFKPDNPSKELQWMISGSNNEKDLAKLGVPFWSAFADETGNLGPVYGYLWRHWPNGDGTETDQLANLRHLLAHDPNSRRMIIDCWHPTFVPDSGIAPKENYKYGKQALTPCHYAINVLTQEMSFGDRIAWLKKNHPGKHALLYPVTGKGWVDHAEEKMNQWNVPTRFLDLKFIMRSSDTVLGLPANFSFYGHMAIALATEANMVPRYLCYSGMDVHMYVNHIDGVREQLEWAKEHPAETFGELAQVVHEAPVGTPITEYDHTQFKVINYEKESIGPFKRFPIAV